MNHLDHLVNNKKVFFDFMNENYTIYQYSNLFFRDLQYAIMAYFDMKNNAVNYSRAENIAKDFIDKLIESKDLDQIDPKSWRINFEIGIVKNEAEGVENEQ